MKIVMIHGQSHKGTSYHMGRFLTERLNEAENVSEFFLPQDMPEFCYGCYQCIEKGAEACPHYQKKKPVTEAIEEADLLIFTTPVYCMRTTAPMKALLELNFSRWMNHKPDERMFFKKAVILSAGAGGGMGKAVKDIKINLDNWGISSVGTYKMVSGAMSWKDVGVKKKEKLEQDMTALAVKIKNSKVKVSAGQKFHFLCMRLMQKMNWRIPEDRAYWEAKGWLGKKRPWKRGNLYE